MRFRGRRVLCMNMDRKERAIMNASKLAAAILAMTILGAGYKLYKVNARDVPGSKVEMYVDARIVEVLASKENDED